MVSPSSWSTAWHGRVAVAILGSTLALGAMGCGGGGDTVVDLGVDHGGGGDAEVADIATADMDMGGDDQGPADLGPGDLGSDAGNQAPTITQLATVTMPEDGSMTVTFDVADADLGDTIMVSASSSNNALFPLLSPNAATGSSRTVSLFLDPPANANGTTTITVSASDGVATTTMSFTANVTAVNDPPIIVLNSANPQTTTMNTPTGPISFTVTDIDDPPCTLMLGSFTSDDLLLPTRTFSPVGSCTADGDSATRTVTVTPGSGRSGSGMVTLRVTDSGSLFLQLTFTVNVLNPS